jgi:hypothetical protein
MVERYRVLGAAIALGKFTVADLVQFSGVKENTVRTVLGRDSSYFEQVDVNDEPTRRGGQFKHYRLRADHAERLRSVVDDVFRRLGVPEAPSAGPEPARVPLGILAAEDRLLRIFPQAENPEDKREILRLAEISLQGGRAEADLVLQHAASGHARERILAHTESANILTGLCRSELDVALGRPFRASASPIRFMELSVRLGELGETCHAASLLRRFCHSPVREGLIKTEVAEESPMHAQAVDMWAEGKARAAAMPSTNVLQGCTVGSYAARLHRLYTSLAKGAEGGLGTGVEPLRERVHKFWVRTPAIADVFRASALEADNATHLSVSVARRHAPALLLEAGSRAEPVSAPTVALYELFGVFRAENVSSEQVELGGQAVLRHLRERSAKEAARIPKASAKSIYNVP